MAKIQFVGASIGNSLVTGYVNFISEDQKRLSIGTGSYTKKGSTEKVFKGSVTVFLDDAFDGAVPKLKDYVQVSGDLTSVPRQNGDGLVYNANNEVEMNHTFNVRFANQLVVIEAPKKKETTPAAAGAEGSDDI